MEKKWSVSADAVSGRIYLVPERKLLIFPISASDYVGC